MSHLGPARAALLLAAVATGCNKDYPNPFAAGSLTKAPPPGAALVFTSEAWSTTPGAGRELYSMGADGSNPTRLTFCNDSGTPCDTDEAALDPKAEKAVVTRAKAGVQGMALVYIDLTRGVEADLAPASSVVNGIDWAVSGDVLAYSGLGAGNLEDLFRADPNGQNVGNLTQTADVRERKPRIDPATTIVVYERIANGGKAEVYVFTTTGQQTPVSPPGPGGASLPGTPYLVGSDADPCFSPDAASVAFRRLTAVDSSGLGTWDVVTAKTNGQSPVAVASGPVYRGAPDWGTAGIVFPEVDVAAGKASIVLIQPDGSGRRVLYTQGSRFALSNPRWLRRAAQ